MIHLDKNTDFGRKHKRKTCPPKATSLATGHEAAFGLLNRAKKFAHQGNRSKVGIITVVLKFYLSISFTRFCTSE